MKAKIQVLGVTSFVTKQNQTRYSAVCLDLDDTGNRLLNTFEYQVNEKDVEKLASEKVGGVMDLQDKICVLVINKIEAGFGGMMRMSGRIFEFVKAKV